MYLSNLSDICILVCGPRKTFSEAKHFGACKTEHLKHPRSDYSHGPISLLLGLHFGLLCTLSL